jgi:hypothetical protein
MLAQHEPYPAVVMDRGWNVVRANDGATTLFGRLLAPAPMPEPANVLALMIEPGPVRDAVRNWDVVVPALLERTRREALGGALDADTAASCASSRSSRRSARRSTSPPRSCASRRSSPPTPPRERPGQR